MEKGADNQRFWSSERRALGYAARGDLYAAERRFIEEHREAMATWRMLDLGIGGGRSTIHFAPLVAEYVGTEYSDVMLESCRKRFDGFRSGAPPMSLSQVDARDLSAFADRSFDFVLFSFNGIDEVDHVGRLLVLAEVHRVLKPGGLFLFSSHNLLVARRLLRFEFSARPRRLIRSIWRYVRIREANRDLASVVDARDYVMIHDYPLDWGKVTYHVSPDEQLSQLERSGFRESHVYLEPSPDGVVVDARDSDAWLHYVCRA
jgi:ubiquinone/menaquinone biosynthesis C-methylase UbiE